MLNTAHRHPVIAGCLLILLEATYCFAQEAPRDHSCTIDGAGIFSTPAGKDRQNFTHGGWGFQAGGGFAVTRPAEPNHGHNWFVTGNYLYTKFKVRGDRVPFPMGSLPMGSPFANATSAHGSFSAITLDPTFRLIPSRRYSLYWSGGFGWLRRGLSFNSSPMTSSSTPTPPPTPSPLFPGGTSLGGEASNSGVFDFGMGVNLMPKSFHGLMLFVEGRVYHGTAINSLSTLVPISLGVRW
jgi:hypothetical protein